MSKVNDEEETDLEAKLELDEDTLVILDTEEENEKAQSFQQMKKEKKRLIIAETTLNAVDKAEEINQNKDILIICANSNQGKEILQIVKSRQEPKTKGALFTNNISIAFKRNHLHKLNPDFIIVHVDCDYNFINESAIVFNLTDKELEEIANAFIKKDANRELCRKCKEEDSESLPYGEETGNIEWQPQFSKAGQPLLDDNNNQLYVAFPELTCSKGHRWYKGEGARRNVKGKNAVLLDSHYKMRQQREIHVDIGTPDPAFTRDRAGKPTRGIFNRTHPSGRKVNTPEQRKKSGASFYRLYRVFKG